jgi:choline dehydrogenase
MATRDQPTFDYIVVGSGAGGGPVAANLAGAGFEVLLLEAGSYYKSLNYAVPGFHGQSTQDPNLRWDFWVRHYKDDAQQEKDSKYYLEYPKPKGPDDPTPRERVDGVLYPRCGTLGGCTAHNAMITVYPHNSDWEEMARIARTYDPADSSWDPDNMRGYFERIERCGYIAPTDPDLARWRHGASGYLGTSVADLALLLGDLQLLKIVVGAVDETLLELALDSLGGGLDSLGDGLERLVQLLTEIPNLTDLFNVLIGVKDPARLKSLAAILVKLLDPNRYPVTLGRKEGAYLIPLAVSNGLRNGSRERILQVQRQFPGNLTIKTDALVTKILLEGNRAVGVEYVEGQRLYEAAPAPESNKPRNPAGPPVQIRARREVIISGGTFNTPQLLMLSGIGPKEDLVQLGFPDEVLIDRPAVGRYLQDRYEVAVISQSPQDFAILDGLRFRLPREGEAPDSALQMWEASRTGIYSTNGAVVAIIRRSSPELEDPDLFIFGLPASFKGYYPAYADVLEEAHNEFTWAILKAHTKNKGGRVSLRSTEPTERPVINFHYFEEGTDQEDADLRAVVEGVKFVRAFTGKRGLKSRLLVRKEVQPEPSIDKDEEIAQWVKNEAWGHHACGTCRIGPKGDVTESVLDSDFRVKGVEGLRVVDASVFPRIPGFFIVSSIYMIAEKASEAILRDAGRGLPDVDWRPLPDSTWEP